MKILLINPPTDYAIRLRGPNRVWYQHEYAPPLGLMAVGAYLKAHGYADVKFINGQTPKPTTDGRILEVVRDWRPDLVGVSVMVMYYYNACRIAGLIKQADPHVKVVFGGPHLTNYGPETVSQPMVDFGVVGEGEWTLLELVRALEAGGDFGAIDGLVWKEGGEVVVNRPRNFDQPLDDLPMLDYSCLDDIRDHRIQFEDEAPTGLIISSRGCPFRCAFCERNYRSYRVRSAPRVVDEMEALETLGYRSITFFDDNFSVKKQRVLEICDRIVARGLKLPWNFRGRVDKFDEELAAAVTAAGCTRVTFGIESGTQEMLDVLKKDITLEQSRAAVALTKKHGLLTLCYIMAGLPGETRELARRTADFILELDPDYMVACHFMPLPGSPFYQNAVASGDFPDYFADFAKHPSPDLPVRYLETTMTEQEVFSHMRETYLRFYLRPSKFRSIGTKIKSYENFRAKTITAFRTAMRLIQSYGD